MKFLTRRSDWIKHPNRPRRETNHRPRSRSWLGEESRTDGDALSTAAALETLQPDIFDAALVDARAAIVPDERGLVETLLIVELLMLGVDFSFATGGDSLVEIALLVERATVEEGERKDDTAERDPSGRRGSVAEDCSSEAQYRRVDVAALSSEKQAPRPGAGSGEAWCVGGT